MEGQKDMFNASIKRIDTIFQIRKASTRTRRTRQHPAAWNRVSESRTRYEIYGAANNLSVREQRYCAFLCMDIPIEHKLVSVLLCTHCWLWIGNRNVLLRNMRLIVQGVERHTDSDRRTHSNGGENHDITLKYLMLLLTDSELSKVWQYCSFRLLK